MTSAKDDRDDKVEWVAYSSAGYGSAEDDLWDDVVPIESKEKEIDWYDDNILDDDTVVQWDAPPCPAPLGIAHLVRIGCCDHCLHRLAGVKTESTGFDGGSQLRKTALENNSDLITDQKKAECPTCENLLEDVGNVSKIILDACDGLDFSTVQIGVHIPKDLMEEEDRIRSKYGAPGSKPLKSTFVDETQQIIREGNEKINFVKEKPDLMVLIDTLTLRVDVDVRPVFFYGRYTKTTREIPQTRWPCRSCRGRSGGCEACNSTGLQYIDSVQDLIGRPFVDAMQASDTAFHGMGREDIDVRCLGSGRPFVLEVKSPVTRKPDLAAMESEIETQSKGQISVNSLRSSDRKEVARIKQTRSEKTYTIRFKVEETADEDHVRSSIMALTSEVIEQQTPTRVSHRRADKIRKRKITAIQNLLIEGDEIELSLRCEAGTYIKELVHSDDGRTKPSVSSVLGTACEVLWLDVEDVHSD